MVGGMDHKSRCSRGVACTKLKLDLLSRYKADDGTGNIYLDPEGWQKMLQEMLEKAKNIIPEQFA